MAPNDKTSKGGGPGSTTTIHGDYIPKPRDPKEFEERRRNHENARGKRSEADALIEQAEQGIVDNLASDKLRTLPPQAADRIRGDLISTTEEHTLAGHEMTEWGLFDDDGPDEASFWSMCEGCEAMVQRSFAPKNGAYVSEDGDEPLTPTTKKCGHKPWN